VGSRFLRIARKAARLGGRIHIKNLKKGSLQVQSKELSYDLVTESDLEAEKGIAKLIHKHFPHHNILGEEQEYEQTDSPYTWIIDPLDGTNNYSKGLPQFSVSVALALEGEVIAGAVFEPSRKELFYAEKGKGAYLNGKAISVSQQEQLEGAMAITGFYYNRGEKMKQTLRQIEALFGHNIIGLRRLGSAAVDICYIACGRADIYWEFELSPWDYGAASLILSEAGGQITDYQGNPLLLERGPIAASNTLLHRQLLNLLTIE